MKREKSTPSQSYHAHIRISINYPMLKAMQINEIDIRMAKQRQSCCAFTLHMLAILFCFILCRFRSLYLSAVYKTENEIENKKKAINVKT